MSKKLTQVVFDDLSLKYQWAAVDANGECYAFVHKPRLMDHYDQWVRQKNQRFIAKFVGSDFDASDWQNSLIERTESEENQALAEAQAEIQVLKKRLELVTAQRDALLEDNAHFCELLKTSRRQQLQPPEDL